MLHTKVYNVVILKFPSNKSKKINIFKINKLIKKSTEQSLISTDKLKPDWLIKN